MKTATKIPNPDPYWSNGSNLYRLSEGIEYQGGIAGAYADGTVADNGMRLTEYVVCSPAHSSTSEIAVFATDSLGRSIAFKPIGQTDYQSDTHALTQLGYFVVRMEA